jgi:transcriptional regulator with XRE-family HTH domain
LTPLEKKILMARAREATRSGEAKIIRRNAGWTQDDVGAFSRISRVSVVNYESGKRQPSGEAGYRYAITLMKLGLPVRELEP